MRVKLPIYYLTAALLFVGGLTTVAYAAAPRGAIELASANIFQTKSAGKTYTCGNLPPWTPGRLVGGLFYPSKTEIAALKSQLKTASRAKAATLKTQITARTNYMKKGNSVCRAGKPAVSPTPTPPSGNGFFDSAGRVTAAGKVAFGIPSSFSASAGAGITAWKQECAGCHGSVAGVLRIKTYSPMRARVQLSPMSFSVPSDLSEQQIADIVAFANF